MTRGGFATIYRAWQPTFEREVAVKVLCGKADDAAVRGFRRECAAIGALSGHPNIVTVYEAGTTRDGRLFIVMEFLPGGTLADRMAERGPFEVAEVLDIGARIAGAVESAHRAGILHRDLKPENILLSRLGEPKVGDFGLAQLPSVTPTAAVGITATIVHAAPEVLDGEEPTVASDIYSLASTLYCLGAGRAPFDRPGGASLAAIVGRVLHDPPPDLRPMGIPDQLCRIVEQGLAKAPADRQHDVGQVGRQLQAARVALGHIVTRLPIESAEPAPAASSVRAMPTPKAAILRQDPALDVVLPPTSVSPASADPGRAASAPVAGRTKGNLPRARSSFVGRRSELDEVASLVAPGGLVTVIGPGGVGKTRLAIQVGRRLEDAFADGVWLVELAALTEASLVVGTTASCLGVREEPARPLIDTLVDAVATKPALVVLDNCEHVLEAVAALTDALLAASASIGILATSREPLRIEGERVWRLGTLGLPAGDDLSPEAVMGADAARLFCERASALGSFMLSAESAPAVARLTRRLDGVPLALELAAALIPGLNPAQILERLDERFDLLVRGYRTASARQQTLWATVEWGHGLLAVEEQRLFGRLGVFAGSFTLPAAERVGTPDGPSEASVASLLDSLVQRCMVEVTGPDDGGRRYRLLETLRQFALAKLESASEAEATRGRHLDWVLALAEAFDSACGSPEEQPWMERLAAENDNLRQAMEWGISSRPAQALRLGGLLGNFWARRGDLSEGRRWLREALAAAPHAPLETRALALRRAGVLALLQDDQAAALSLLHAAASAYRRTGDTDGLGHVLGFLGVAAYEQGDLMGPGTSSRSRSAFCSAWVTSGE
ncbi:MAG: protein kinase domain-containing protein [Acidimicrobiales bacterium]